MTVNDVLTTGFERHRPRLRGLAIRMLGSPAAADDVVQEAWLRLNRNGADGIDDLGRWLTTVVGRLCLDVLRSRRRRAEQPLDDIRGADATTIGEPPAENDPAAEVIAGDMLGIALLAVLDVLSPTERIAFVLHDVFGVPFEEVAAVVDRSVPGARQLASRARRRVRLAGQEGGVQASSDPARQRVVVSAFLAASKQGDFDALLQLLDPEVSLQADPTVVKLGGPARIDGARGVATMLCGKARAVRLVLVDGLTGAVWSLRGVPQVVFAFTVVDGHITRIEQIGDPGRLTRMELLPLPTIQRELLS